MSISLPIYKRGSKFVLHMRLAGKQIKRSLDTSDVAVARVRAIQMLSELMQNIIPTDPVKNLHFTSKFQVQGSCDVPDYVQALSNSTRTDVETAKELHHGTAKTQPYKSTGCVLDFKDNAKSNEQQKLMRYAHKLPTVFVPRTPLLDKDKFKMAVVFANYIAVKKIREVTKVDYASYAKELVPFFKNRDIRTLSENDVSELILHLRVELSNDPRTVDNKVGFLRAVINHLIKHGQFASSNLTCPLPAIPK